jgi:putative chitinase
VTKLEEALYHLKLAEQCIEELQASTPVVVAAPVIVPNKIGLQSPSAFFDHIRGETGELFPMMTATQLTGIQAILDYAAGKLPLGWCAYCLATAYHETGTRMSGVREGFDVSDTWRKAHLHYYPWYGRGLVQLTWEKNYKLAGDKTHVDLIANPDRALDLDVAVPVLVDGMIEGWFSGKKLRDYIGRVPTREQYKNARQIINGHDRDDLVAGYAVVFEEALKLGEWL